MKLLAWFHRKPLAKSPTKKMRCANCEAGIRRGDHYRIVAVAHLDCGDPKQTRQKSVAVEEVV
jgi:hypothetical protein